jgi:hypothetical protein
MTFDPSHPSPVPGITDTAWPTINQLAAIGSVSAAWSWLDLGIEALLARLIEGDEMLAQALTEDLSPDNRLKALRRLVVTWERVVRNLTDDHRAVLAEVREIVTWVARNKGKRNEIIHWVWMRTDDEKLYGWKHRMMPTTQAERPNRYMTKTEILEFSREIGAMAGRVGAAELAARQLPPFPKPPSWTGTPDWPILASLFGPYQLREEP